MFLARAVGLLYKDGRQLMAPEVYGILGAHPSHCCRLTSSGRSQNQIIKVFVRMCLHFDSGNPHTSPTHLLSSSAPPGSSGAKMSMDWS